MNSYGGADNPLNLQSLHHHGHGHGHHHGHHHNRSRYHGKFYHFFKFIY